VSLRSVPVSGDETPVLAARGLTKHFTIAGSLLPWKQRKVLHAVDDVDLDLWAGHVTALVGESGSGKSTVARLLAQLYVPTTGSVLFKGQNVAKHGRLRGKRYYRSQVQMIFQDPFSSLNPVKRIQHHIERPLRIHKVLRRERASSDGSEGKRASGMLARIPVIGGRLSGGHSLVSQRVGELLTTVGLIPPEEFARSFPHQLSGGQRQRVAVARALAVEPIAILADEPISMLDVSIRIGIMNLMLKLKEEHNLAFLFITHDIASARYVADEVVVMYAGHVVERGATDDVLQSPLHPYTRLLLAAVPNPEAGLQTRRVEARGEVPSIVNPAPGCRFAARCPSVMEECRSNTPELGKEGKEQWVRCHLYPARLSPSKDLTLAS